MYGSMGTGMRPTIATYGTTDTTPGLLTRARRGSVLAMKDSSFTPGIGRVMAARNSTIIAGIGTNEIGITTGTTTTADKAEITVHEDRPYQVT